MPLETMVGVSAAICTTASYIPQVWKVWKTREADDLSLKMLSILLAGLLLWIGYGWMLGDGVIMASNAIGSTLVATLVAYKLFARS